MTRQPCGSDVSGARGKHKSRTPLLRQLQPPSKWHDWAGIGRRAPQYVVAITHT